MTSNSLRRAWHVAGRVFEEFSQDRIPTVSGGITFFTLLALFPAIGSVVSLYGLFADQASIGRDLAMLSGFLPGGAITILDSELHRLAAQKAGTLNLAFFLSAAIALWSASGGFKALVEGLNVAYEAKETRSFVRLSANALVFTLAAVVFTAASIWIGLIVPGVTAGGSWLWDLAYRVAAWPLSFAVCSLVMAVIYRFGPNRPAARWRWFTWGGAIAALLWLLGTQAFTWYVAHFGSYNRVYGDLGAAVGFLTWVWLSLVVLLLGAEINCEIERQVPQESEPSDSGQNNTSLEQAIVLGAATLYLIGNIFKWRAARAKARWHSADKN